MAARDRIVRLARPATVPAATAAWVIGAMVNDLQGLAHGVHPGHPARDYALELLARRDDLFCPDVTADPPPGWQPGAHQYRTFLAVPVATEQRAFGIMTIDGLHVGDLTSDDLVAARVFARLLAVALAA